MTEGLNKAEGAAYLSVREMLVKIGQCIMYVWRAVGTTRSGYPSLIFILSKHIKSGCGD